MSRYPRSLLSTEVVDIRQSPDTVSALSIRYLTNRGVISRIRRGLAYKDIK